MTSPEELTGVRLEDAVSDIEPQAVQAALTILAGEDVVIVDGEHVRASRCARHLDSLNLISV